MKKFFFLAFTFLMVFGAKAQTGLNDVSYGVKGGWNITNITNSEEKNKMSIHLGAFAEWKMGDFWSIQPELVYSRQGFRWKDGGKKGKERVNYLNIPVLARLYVLEGLSVDLGPQFGFALNAKSKVKDGGHTSKDKITDFNVFDFSFAIGASYNLDNFIFSARYNIGLTNVFDKSDWDKNNKNHVFQLSVGYRLDNLF